MSIPGNDIPLELDQNAITRMQDEIDSLNKFENEVKDAKTAFLDELHTKNKKIQRLDVYGRSSVSAVFAINCINRGLGSDYSNKVTAEYDNLLDAIRRYRQNVVISMENIKKGK